jgi:5-methylcytosine-specific restriction endonuclease McrA
VQRVPLSPSQKTEVLRRQAFKCDQCQTDLEPIGRAPPHYEYTGPVSTKGASATANVVALCPNCNAIKSNPDAAGLSEAKKRRHREPEPARGGKKFVKSGFDNKKF